MDIPFSGKTALVVGASSGIGLSVIQSLQRQGAQVHGVGRHAVPGIDMTVLDLDTRENGEKVLEMADGCDILVIVRGPFFQESLDRTPPGVWESIVFANLVFPGQLVSAALPHMRRMGWGRILLFGGTRTDRIRGFRTNAAYAAAKTGLSSLVLSVAQQYSSDGITCNALCPGFVESVHMDASVRSELQRRSPGGRLISEQELTKAALFLLESPSVTGAVLRVDRGWSPGFI